MVMKHSLRLFASRIVLLHLLVLGLLIVGVFFVADEVYQRSREQAIKEGQERQKLLVWQTSRAIENYYESIDSNLDLISRDTRQEPAFNFLLGGRTRTPFALAPLLWHQLEGRVSNLFGVVKADNRVMASYPRGDNAAAQRIADGAREWIKTIDKSTRIGAYTPEQRAHLVAVPGQATSAGNPDSRLVLVAVVPVTEVESRFIRRVNIDASSTGIGADRTELRLIDHGGMILSAPAQASVGRHIAADVRDKRVADAVAQFQRGSQRVGISQILRGGDAADSLLRIEPIRVVDQTWEVVAITPLAGLDATVAAVFRKAIWWSAFGIVAITALLVSTAGVMIRARLREERLRRDVLARELQQARRIQLAWLPEHRLPERRIDVAAVNRPASHISGDFYDWFDLDNGRVVVTIGDVTGHGIGAAFLMATVQLLIRTTMLRVKDPGACLEEVNRQLCSREFRGQFVTVLVMVVDTEQGAVQAATAGHFPPVYADGQRLRTLPMQNQLVLGVSPEERYATETFPLEQSFTLLMYTDGVVDACSAYGERFAYQGLEQAMSLRADSAHEVVTRVTNAVERFCGDVELADDLTLVAIRGG